MRYTLVALLSLFAFGCAHGKMGVIEQPLKKEAIASDRIIYVIPVNVDNARIKGDKANDQQRISEIKSELRARVHREIANDLRKKGFKAEAVDTVPKAGLILEGKVTQIDNGSGATRFWVGFGAGSANMFTDFKLYNKNGDETLTKFEIIATSGGNSRPSSFLEAHIEDCASKTAEYITQANTGTFKK